MSNNFIIEEFDKYKVFLYGQKYGGELTYYGIDIVIPSGKVFFRFTDNAKKDNKVIAHGDKKYFYVYLAMAKYPAWIDILRNEMPLYFYYNFDDDSSYITTTDEPVGENEISLHKLADGIGDHQDHE